MKIGIDKYFYQRIVSSAAAMLLILAGFADLIPVSAKYLHQAEIEDNHFTAGILDAAWVDAAQVDDEAGASTTVALDIANQGGLDLAYELYLNNKNLAPECSGIDLDFYLDDILLYSGQASAFVLVNDYLAAADQDPARLEFQYAPQAGLFCELELGLRAKQVGISLSGLGFTDEEILPIYLPDPARKIGSVEETSFGLDALPEIILETETGAETEVKEPFTLLDPGEEAKTEARDDELAEEEDAAKVLAEEVPAEGDAAGAGEDALDPGLAAADEAWQKVVERAEEARLQASLETNITP